MKKSPIRMIGSQLTTAVVAAVVASVVVAGGFAYAQEAPAEVGTGVAEVAAANSVDSAAIINAAVTGQDIAPATIGRGDLKAGLLTRWARVNGGIATKLVDGRGAVSMFRPGVGVYRVTFAEAVTGCGLTATLTDNGNGVSAPGQISVEGSSTVTDVIVRTYNTAGAPADTAETDGATVTVNC